LKIKLDAKIITGLSGAGKSVVLKALEDAGYYCIDNIPTDVIYSACLSLKKRGITALALGIGIRERDYLASFETVCGRLRKAGFNVDVIYLDAGDEIIARRFRETRRPHPLLLEGGSLKDAIERERKTIGPFSRQADRIITTESFSPHQLRDLILKSYGRSVDCKLRINVISFGFKFGTPSEADIMMDVRFLPNPHFVPELRPFTGLDRAVADFVLLKDETREFLEKFHELLVYLIPRYRAEGKSALGIAIGCTGGRHRSAAIVESLAARLRKLDKVDIFTYHRELEPK